MADGIKLTLDTSDAQEILDTALGRLEDPSILFESIGQSELERTLTRFNRGVAPDGSPWAGLTETTKKFRRGTTSQVLRDTSRLFRSIEYIVNKDNVQIGTNLIYAATHQFGRPTNKFFNTPNGNPAPIPARPFLGVDSNTEQDIIDITLDYLDRIFE